MSFLDLMEHKDNLKFMHMAKCRRDIVFSHAVSIHFQKKIIANFGPALDLLSAIHDNCNLLSLLLMYFGGLYCKHNGPRSDCSLGSILIWDHSVCNIGFISKGNQ